MSSLNERDISSASVLETPATWHAVKYISLSRHQNQTSRARSFNTIVLPPNLFIYAQLVVLSINILTWALVMHLQNAMRANWQALSSSILIWHSCSSTDH